MKLSYKKFRLMLLRPALYNGEEVELEVQFEESSFWRTNCVLANAIDLKPGDTVKICGRACFDEYDEFVSIYASEALLTEFVDRYGYCDITATISMRVKLVYAMFGNDNGLFEEEIVAFKLLELL